MRRLVEVRKRNDIYSLVALLQDVARNPSVLSRARYVARYDPKGDDAYLRQLANNNYDQYAGAGRSMLSVSKINRRISELRARAEIVTKYVDKQIAHKDKTPPKQTPAFQDLHRVITDIYSTFEWALLLIGQRSRAYVVPVFQYDWFEFFRHPWLAAGEDIPAVPDNPGW